MDFIVLSCSEAARFKTDVPHIHISLGFNDLDFPKLGDNAARKAHLKIQCEDVDADTKYSFNNRHAREILELVKQYHNDIDLIVVNCVAGQSRSAGTAAALAKIMTNDDTDVVKKKPAFNRWIYRIILREFERHYEKFEELQIDTPE